MAWLATGSVGLIRPGGPRPGLVRASLAWSRWPGLVPAGSMLHGCGSFRRTVPGSGDFPGPAPAAAPVPRARSRPGAAAASGPAAPMTPVAPVACGAQPTQERGPGATDHTGQRPDPAPGAPGTLGEPGTPGAPGEPHPPHGPATPALTGPAHHRDRAPAAPAQSPAHRRHQPPPTSGTHSKGATPMFHRAGGGERRKITSRFAAPDVRTTGHRFHSARYRGRRRRGFPRVTARDDGRRLAGAVLAGRL